MQGGCMLTNDAITGLPEGAFSGPVEFSQLVRDALALAAAQGWRSLVISDASFEDWPLRERVVVDALQAWAGRPQTNPWHSVLILCRDCIPGLSTGATNGTTSLNAGSVNRSMPASA